MFNISKIIDSLKEVIMSGQLTDKQQDRMVNSMCVVALMISFGIAMLPIAWLIIRLAH